MLIADDSPRSRAGLKALLATKPLIEVIAEASDGQEAARLVDKYSPDVVLMEYRMAGINTLSATAGQLDLEYLFDYSYVSMDGIEHVGYRGSRHNRRDTNPHALRRLVGAAWFSSLEHIS